MDNCKSSDQGCWWLIVVVILMTMCSKMDELTPGLQQPSGNSRDAGSQAAAATPDEEAPMPP